MNKAIISIGSNSVDSQTQMEFAVRHIKSKFANVVSSTIYETKALNGIDADYKNAVVVADTENTFEVAEKFLKQWEVLCGRTPASKVQGVIPIDLDIVVWNNEIVREKDYSCAYFSQGYNQLIALGEIQND